MASTNHPLLAAALMVLACVLFTLMALLVKRVSHHVHWYEITAVRGFSGAMTIFLVARIRGISLMVHDRRTQWGRTIAGTCAMSFSFYALTKLPMGDGATIGSLSTLLLALLSKRALREQVGFFSFFSITLGLLGVAMMTGARLHMDRSTWPGLFAALAGAVMSTIAMLQLRKLSTRESAEGVSLHFTLWAGVTGLVVSLLMGAHIPPTQILLELILAGSAGGLAQWVMTLAYGQDKAARVAAIGYSGVFMSQVAGAFLLHEQTTWKQWIGGLLIITSGVFIVASKEKPVLVLGSSGKKQ